MYASVTRVGTKFSFLSGHRNSWKLVTKENSRGLFVSVRHSFTAYQYRSAAFTPTCSSYNFRDVKKLVQIFQVPCYQVVKSYTCTNSRRQLSTTLPKTKRETVSVTFVKKDGTRIVAEGKEGDSIYDIVTNNHLDIDGYGACEGTASCSTCHLIFKKDDYEKINDKPTDEEQDLLDLAFDLSDTSRLGCMVHITKELSGIEVHVPENINDVRAL